MNDINSRKKMQILNSLKDLKALSSDSMTVLDIGARASNIGHWKVFGKNLRYLGFEPDPEECFQLNENVKKQQESWQETYFPIALGKNCQKRLFYVTERAGCSSLLEPNIQAVESFITASLVKPKEVKEVETCSLAEWSKTYDIKDVDYIKVDVQGAELEILQGGQDILTSSLALEVEVEFLEVYKGQPLFNEVDTWIRSQGFILFDISKVFNKRTNLPEQIPSQGQLTWGDALYFRDIDSLFEISKNDSSGRIIQKLYKLAAIADLYKRPDYGLYILEQALEKYPEKLEDSYEELQGVVKQIYSDLIKEAENNEKNGWIKWLRAIPSTFRKKLPKKLMLKKNQHSYSWRG